MNDDIPLEAPPVDDDQLGADAGGLPAAPRGTAPGRNLAPSAGASSKSAGKKSTPSNMPPVGDIQLKKKSGTYNTYNIQLSYGQIEAIRQALEADHANPIGDELKALFDYYISTIPGPGEEEEDVKARDEQAAMANGQAAAAGDDDSPVPMPPGDESGEGTTVAGEGPEEMGDDADLHIPPVEGEEDYEEELPEPPGDEPEGLTADDYLSAPPRE